MRIPFRKLPAPERKGFVEEQINEAMARGEFDNLRGQGKPLRLQGDLSKREVMREKLRGDAGYGVPWEEVGREIETQTQRAEAELRRALEFRTAGLSSGKADPTKIQRDFQEHLTRVDAAIGVVNSLVLKHNLLLPSALPHLYRARLTLATLVERTAPEARGVLFPI